jgi:hypothetical protein
MKYLLLLLVSYSVSATTFKRVPLETQLKEANGVFIGNYLKSQSVRLEDGTIATQMVFKMDREVGFQSEQFGMDEVIIHYPGGSLDGVTTVVQGVPSFNPGEKVALLSKSVDNRFWGLDLSYGSYKVIVYGSTTVLFNLAFPENQEFGQITLTDFEAKVGAVKSPLTIVRSPIDVTASRSIASVDEMEQVERTVASEKVPEPIEPSQDYFWLLFFLSLMGGIFEFVRKKKSSR